MPTTPPPPLPPRPAETLVRARQHLCRAVCRRLDILSAIVLHLSLSTPVRISEMPVQPAPGGGGTVRPRRVLFCTVSPLREGSLGLRVSFFVDGFNLYHSIRDLGRNDLKWLDIVSLSRALAGQIRLPDVQPPAVQDVYYFSAIAKHLEGRSNQTGSPTARHRQYLRAIEHFDAKVMLSTFKRRQRGGIVYHEEKGTDVWLAAKLMDAVLRRECDGAVIVSGDSDFVPAARMARTTAPVWFAPPPRRSPNPRKRRHHNELRRAATGLLSLKFRHYEDNQLPDRILDAAGSVIATRPKQYLPTNPSA